MEKFYTAEKNTQMLIALMKHHGVKKVVASPGTTNICLVGSLQHDPYFEIYSAVDERSAAYMACGLAAESGESVALSCTGATASRNYVPGLTEAFYRKLPVLAITSTQHIGRIGNHMPQVIDRSVQMNDLVKYSVQIPVIQDPEEEWSCNVMINKALLELTHHGGGPVHINLTTTYDKNFSVRELPDFRAIDRLTYHDTKKMPKVPAGRVAIFVGAHSVWSEALTDAVNEFCTMYNGVVICDQTSNYRGKFRVDGSLVSSQEMYRPACVDADLIVHIGEISGAYMGVCASQVWRVSPDGEVRDTFQKLRYVFEMEEVDFFGFYTQKSEIEKKPNTYLDDWRNECKQLWDMTCDLPFSNAWIARETAGKLPADSSVYFGILNTLRVWNFYRTPDSVSGYSNTGGFGIDGGLSSLLGMSLADRDKIYIGIIGDLGFFYDMNAAGNRHVSPNLRIMLINNGRGTEFRNYNHPAERFGDDADAYMAAAGHFGNQSKMLVKHYAEDLGFIYMSAATKEEYLKQLPQFLDSQIGAQPMLFEIFTDSKDESDALKNLYHLKESSAGKAKQAVKSVLGDNGVRAVKKMLGRI